MQHLQSLVDAGLNYIHLLPMNDIATVNEDRRSTVDLTDTVADLCALNPAAQVCVSHAGEQVLQDVYASLDPRTPTRSN